MRAFLPTIAGVFACLAVLEATEGRRQLLAVFVGLAVWAHAGSRRND